MIILKDKQAVLLQPKNPAQITTVIPSAKIVKTAKGPMVAVPHRPDETRVLRSLGYDVPSPMQMYYDFPAKFKPFEAQRISAEFATMNDRCFILNSMGLGKTITTLWAYDYLKKCGQVRSMLVVCPLSTLERTWADEAFFSFPQYKVNVLYGTKEKRLKLLKDPADIYLINTDGAKIIVDELAARRDIDLIVIDELALMRTKTTDRWKALNTICNKQTPRRVWGLTGSPIPNSPADAYAQIRLVTPNNKDCPLYYNSFRNQVMTQVNQFKWLPKPDSAAYVHRVMQPAVRFSIDECLDLPPQVFLIKKAELSAPQQKAYKAMLSSLQVQFEEGDITASNEAIKASKLMQIALGSLYGDNDTVVEYPIAKRLEVLMETIEASEGKCIVFIPFTAALQRVSKFLTDNEVTNEVIDGSTSKEDRDRIFALFQRTDDPKVLVANPTAMSHGLTLTAATTIIWFGPVYSNETYQQACARVRRPGQKHTTVIVHIVSTKYEEMVYERLKNRQSLQGTLLDLMRETTSSCN